MVNLVFGDWELDGVFEGNYICGRDGQFGRLTRNHSARAVRNQTKD